MPQISIFQLLKLTSSVTATKATVPVQLVHYTVKVLARILSRILAI